jgi:hypothetical protein
MLLTRLLSLTLRFSQFTCAAVVLVLASLLLQSLDHMHHMDHSECHGRLIYSVMIAGISLIASLIWFFPTTSHVVNVVGDMLFCGAWFGVFGLLQDYYRGALGCGGIWAWEAMGVRNGMCSRWMAAQAFAFLSAVFWGVSLGLGGVVWRKAKKRDGAGAV